MLTTIMFALLFVAWVGEAPPAIDPDLYYARWRSPFGVFGPLLAPLPGISLTPWQLLLVALAPFCLAASKATQRSREMDRAIITSFTCVAITVLWGLVSGGSAYFAYYQLWRLLCGLLVAYMLLSVVRTPRDLSTLGKLVALAALIRATLCIYYYWTYLHGKVVYPAADYVTNHDDSLLFVAGILIISVWACLKGGKATWTVAIVAVAGLFYAIVLNDRRIAWVELVLALPAIYLLFGPGPLRSRINRWAMMAAPLVLVYVVVGWGNQSPMFAPVAALSSAGSNYDPSSLTRQEEIRNLLYTLTESGNPLLGTGWGVPYIRAESYWSRYAASWILVLYTPHNSLLGLAVYAGLVGIVGIWGVVPMAAFLATRGYRRSTEPVPRGAAMIAVGCLVGYGVHAYGDVGLQSFACNLLMGAALAAAGKVAAWSEALPAAQTATTVAGGTRATPRPRPTYGKAGATRGRHEPASQQPGPAAGNDVAAKTNRVPTRRLSR